MVHFSEQTTAVVWVDELGVLPRIKDRYAPLLSIAFVVKTAEPGGYASGLACTVATST
jgi:hypothetical protein